MRIDYERLEPNAVKAILGLKEFVRTTGLDESLIGLIEIRSSQINGCAYCLDMHTQDATAMGEKEQRIFCISAWRDAPFFSDREKVALEFTEAVTRISENGVDDDLYNRVRTHFNEREFIGLVMAINTINCWNRISISCGLTAGMYKRSP
ncbi:MAG: carboxymuconolactone decarboxylase family protein [Thermoplasmatales archaeon]|jgi:AhpD family alkylhydroperoxidase|nr:carboxymuconolactone decarboxylase family protein [Thermoplasmatales archaeon]